MTPATLSVQYLRTHCPIAWNTPERRETYERLGYDMIGELFRVVQDFIGKEEIDPRKLPLRVELKFAVRAAEGPPVIRLSKRQDGDIQFDPGTAPCSGPDNRPALCAAYLDERMPRAWDDPDGRHTFAMFGYTIERTLIHRLIEEPIDCAETTQSMSFTVDTTLAGGGCSIICTGRHCAHVRPH